MPDILVACWNVLAITYFAVYGNGYTGCLLSFVVGAWASHVGVGLTGRQESFTGSLANGYAAATRSVSIPGYAKTPLGRLGGLALQMLGACLFVIGFLAAVNRFVYGPLS